MKRIIHMLLLSCKRTTELIEKKSLFQLSRKEQFQLSIHIRICEFCTIYQQQSILLDKIMDHQVSSLNKLPIVPHVKNEVLKSNIIFNIEASSV